MSQDRLFLICPKENSWNKLEPINGDSLESLKEVFAANFPDNKIVEVVSRGIKSPVAFFYEVTLQDSPAEIDIRNIECILKCIMSSLRDEVLPDLDELCDTDQGHRVSYTWDKALRALSLHFVLPNTYRSCAMLYEKIKSIRLKNAKLATGYLGYVLQDKIRDCRLCVPLYMGREWKVLTSKSPDDFYVIDTARPAQQQEEAPTLQPKGHPGGASSRIFGGRPLWLVDKDIVTEFFVRMIQRRSRDYDEILTDVVYTECATASQKRLKDIIDITEKKRVISRKPLRFLYWIARRACPEEYQTLLFEQAALGAYYFSSSLVTDDLFHHLFLLALEGEFISLNRGEDEITVFHFDNIWQKDQKKVKLKAKVCKLLSTFFGTELQNYMKQSGHIDLYQPLVAEALRINYMDGPRTRTVNAIAEMLNEPNVKFDENPYLLACTNRIIVLSDDGASDRPGRPEDLISKSTGHYYRKYSEQECEEVRANFRKLFPNPETRAWVERWQCSFLEGRNLQRKFYVPQGPRMNGKSGLLNFWELALGDYFDKFNPAALTPVRDPSAANSALSALKGKRLAGTSELEPDDVICCSILKALCGEDAPPTREIYQKQEKMRYVPKLVIMTNHFPQFKNADKATRDRGVFIPMRSTFGGEGVPKTIEEQIRRSHFPAIKDFMSVAERLAPVLLFMMIESFGEYRTVGLEQLPEEIKSLTEGFWNEAGVQPKFIKECIEFVDQDQVPPPSSASVLPAPPVLRPRPKLTYDAAYDRFSAWCVRRKIDVNRYPLLTFKSLMDCEFASCREHKIEFEIDGWIGLKLKS